MSSSTAILLTSSDIVTTESKTTENADTKTAISPETISKEAPQNLLFRAVTAVPEQKTGGELVQFFNSLNFSGKTSCKVLTDKCHHDAIYYKAALQSAWTEVSLLDIAEYYNIPLGDVALVKQSFDQSPKTVKKSLVQVETSITVINMGELNQQDLTFYADFVLLAEWEHDDVCWSPHLAIWNAHSLELMFDTGNIRLSQDDRKGNWVRRTKRWHGTLYEGLELENFPFDVQPLTMAVHTGCPNDQVKIVPHPTRDSVMSGNFVLAGWWILPNAFCVEGKTEKRQSGSGRVYSILHFGAVAVRQSSFYIVNIILLLFILVTSTLFGWCFQGTELEARLNIDVTLLLTAVTFKFVIKDSLPKGLSYLTKLDWYVLICFGFLFSVMIAHLIVGVLEPRSPEIGSTVDNYLLIILGSVWSLGNFILFLWFMCTKRVEQNRIAKAIQYYQENVTVVMEKYQLDVTDVKGALLDLSASHVQEFVDAFLTKMEKLYDSDTTTTTTTATTTTTTTTTTTATTTTTTTTTATTATTAITVATTTTTTTTTTEIELEDTTMNKKASLVQL